MLFRYLWPSTKPKASLSQKWVAKGKCRSHCLAIYPSPERMTLVDVDRSAPGLSAACCNSPLRNSLHRWVQWWTDSAPSTSRSPTFTELAMNLLPRSTNLGTGYTWKSGLVSNFIFSLVLPSIFSSILSISSLNVLAREKRSSAFPVWALPMLYDNPSEQSVIAFWLSLPFPAHATPSCFSNLAARSARHRKTASQRITTMELPLDSFNSFRQGLLDPGPDTHHLSYIRNKSYSRLFKIACNPFLVILS